MSDWRYFATRLNGDGTEQLIAPELPLDDPDPQKVLSGPDSLNCSIPVEMQHLRGDDGRPIFVPWSSAIYAEKDGRIRVGGILTDVEIDGPKLSLTVEGFTAYPHGLPYTDEKAWPSVDPLDVVRHIWEHIQAADGGNLGLVVDGTTSPVRLPLPEEDADDKKTPDPYRLAFYSTQDLGQILDDLAEATPFDYAEEHEWDGETIRHTLRLGYPTLGRRRTDLRFVVGENVIVDPKVTLAGDEYASEAFVLGAGEGRAMIQASSFRKRDRLRRVAVVTDKTIRSKRHARTVGDLELRRLTGDEDVETITVRDHPNARVGAWQLGDEILLQGSGGGWAPDLYLWVRVLDFSYDTKDGDAATLTVSRADRTT